MVMFGKFCVFGFWVFISRIWPPINIESHHPTDLLRRQEQHPQYPATMSGATQWIGAFDLNCSSTDTLALQGDEKGGEVLKKIGFLGDSESSVTMMGSGSSTANRDKQAEIMTKMSWAVAMAPGKQLPMMVFMFWMTGNGLHLFSIMMTGMALMTPVKSLMNMNTAFANIKMPDREINLTQQKLVYIGCVCAGLCVGAWKLNKMGLLPLTSADWVTMVPVREPVEFSG